MQDDSRELRLEKLALEKSRSIPRFLSGRAVDLTRLCHERAVECIANRELCIENNGDSSTVHRGVTEELERKDRIPEFLEKLMT